jgi:hypothetical protein
MGRMFIFKKHKDEFKKKTRTNKEKIKAIAPKEKL